MSTKTLKEMLDSLSDHSDELKVIECQEYGVGSLSEWLSRDENDSIIIPGGESRMKLAKWLDELYQLRVKMQRIKSALND